MLYTTPFGPAVLAFDDAGALTRLTLARGGALKTQDGGAPAQPRHSATNSSTLSASRQSSCDANETQSQNNEVASLVKEVGEGKVVEREVTQCQEASWQAATGSASLPAPAREVVRQLDEYFAGARREFTVPLKPQGTPFQLAVWDELTRIPYGATITYGELARRVDARFGATAAQQAGLDPAQAPGGSLRIRAVGRANGLNPIWIIIPCHRVIGADGSLTGYAGGIAVKRALLELEGALKPSGGGLFE